MRKKKKLEKEDNFKSLFYNKTLYHIVLDNWFDNNIVLEEVEVESYFENSANNTQWIDWQCSSTDCSYNVKNVEKPI